VRTAPGLIRIRAKSSNLARERFQGVGPWTHHCPTRAVFFYRLGEIRDRSFDLLAAAIVLWSTVYLKRVTNALRGHDQAVDDALRQYLSPLDWEHINLTGDYLMAQPGKFRPLRSLIRLSIKCTTHYEVAHGVICFTTPSSKGNCFSHFQ